MAGIFDSGLFDRNIFDNAFGPIVPGSDTIIVDPATVTINAPVIAIAKTLILQFTSPTVLVNAETIILEITRVRDTDVTKLYTTNRTKRRFWAAVQARDIRGR